MTSLPTQPRLYCLNPKRRLLWLRHLSPRLYLHRLRQFLLHRHRLRNLRLNRLLLPQQRRLLLLRQHQPLPRLPLKLQPHRLLAPSPTTPPPKKPPPTQAQTKRRPG